MDPLELKASDTEGPTLSSFQAEIPRKPRNRLLGFEMEGKQLGYSKHMSLTTLLLACLVLGGSLMLRRTRIQTVKPIHSAAVGSVRRW